MILENRKKKKSEQKHIFTEIIIILDNLLQNLVDRLTATVTARTTTIKSLKLQIMNENEKQYVCSVANGDDR